MRPKLPPTLSDSAESAIARLASKGCDPLRLRGYVFMFRQWPKLMPLRQLSALEGRIRALATELKVFTTTFDGLWLFPPVGPPVYPAPLDNLIRSCQEVSQVLITWRQLRRRKGFDQSVGPAFICAYVMSCTGEPHDSEVADIWSDLEDAPEPRSPESTRQFRRRHADLIQLVAKHLAATSAGLSSAPPARAI
jgi:hypothetical protein